MPVTALLFALAGPLLSWNASESVTALTPRGERAQALAGRVHVAGDQAVWELTGGAFPRSAAQAAIAGKGGVTLLDKKNGIYASATREEFGALFLPPEGPATGGAFAPAKVTVSVEPLGPGANFGDAETRRYRVTAEWTLSVKTPGRVGEVRSELTGTLVTAPSLAAARTEFDDPMRLIPARGEVREALERELAKAPGLPVRVELTIVSEGRTERLGGGDAGERERKPAKTTTRIRRELTEPSSRAARPEDAALFAVPDAFHAKPLEALAASPALP